MGKKPKAGGAPRKAKKQKLEDKEQSERFVQMARALDADETGKKFESTVRRMLGHQTKSAN